MQFNPVKWYPWFFAENSFITSILSSTRIQWFNKNQRTINSFIGIIVVDEVVTLTSEYVCMGKCERHICTCRNPAMAWLSSRLRTATEKEEHKLEWTTYIHVQNIIVANNSVFLHSHLYTTKQNNYFCPYFKIWKKYSMGIVVIFFYRHVLPILLERL